MSRERIVTLRVGSGFHLVHNLPSWPLICLWSYIHSWGSHPLIHHIRLSNPTPHLLASQLIKSSPLMHHHPINRSSLKPFSISLILQIHPLQSPPSLPTLKALVRFLYLNSQKILLEILSINTIYIHHSPSICLWMRSVSLDFIIPYLFTLESHLINFLNLDKFSKVASLANSIQHLNQTGAFLESESDLAISLGSQLDLLSYHESESVSTLNHEDPERLLRLAQIYALRCRLREILPRWVSLIF